MNQRLFPAFAAAIAFGCCLATPAWATQEVSAAKLERTLRTEKKITVSGATVVGTFNVWRRPGASASFRNTRFTGPVDLYLGELAEFDCDGCTFEQDVTFHSLQADSLWLVRTTFEGHAVFAAMQIGDLNLADAHFEKTADFSGAEFDSFNAPRLRASQPVLITWDQLGDVWAEDERLWAVAPATEAERRTRIPQVEAQLRFWERNFTELGQDLDAREANFQLIKLKRNEQFKPLSTDYWAARVLEVGSRYGTRPYRPFLIAAIVIAVFTAVFVLTRFQDDGEPPVPLPNGWRLPFAFAFSLQTFVPFLTIPGIKDRWKLKNGRWLEPLEGVMGVLLFGLAAYSLSYAV